MIRGQSRFSAELLTSLLDKTREKLTGLKRALGTAQAELESLETSDVTESDEYDRCSFETKTMIVSLFIKSVCVFRDNQLDIAFNVSYEEFQNLAVNQAVWKREACFQTSQIVKALH